MELLAGIFKSPKPSSSSPTTTPTNADAINLDLKKFRVSLAKPLKKEFADFAREARKEALKTVPIVASARRIHQDQEFLLIELESKDDMDTLLMSMQGAKEFVPRSPSKVENIVVLKHNFASMPKDILQAALVPVGDTVRMQALNGRCFLVEFSTEEAAKKLISEGSIKVGGSVLEARQFFVNSTGKKVESPREEIWSTWLYNLPPGTRDHQVRDMLVNLGSSAWKISHNFGKSPSCWAKVSFKSEEDLNAAIKVRITGGGKLFVWSKVEICSHCGEAPHPDKVCPLLPVQTNPPPLYKTATPSGKTATVTSRNGSNLEALVASQKLLISELTSAKMQQDKKIEELTGLVQDLLKSAKQPTQQAIPEAIHRLNAEVQEMKSCLLQLTKPLTESHEIKNEVSEMKACITKLSAKLEIMSEKAVEFTPLTPIHPKKIAALAQGKATKH